MIVWNYSRKNANLKHCLLAFRRPLPFIIGTHLQNRFVWAFFIERRPTFFETQFTCQSALPSGPSFFTSRVTSNNAVKVFKSQRGTVLLKPLFLCFFGTLASILFYNLRPLLLLLLSVQLISNQQGSIGPSLICVLMRIPMIMLRWATVETWVC